MLRYFYGIAAFFVSLTWNSSLLVEVCAELYALNQYLNELSSNFASNCFLVGSSDPSLVIVLLCDSWFDVVGVRGCDFSQCPPFVS